MLEACIEWCATGFDSGSAVTYIKDLVVNAGGMVSNFTHGTKIGVEANQEDCLQVRFGT